MDGLIPSYETAFDAWIRVRSWRVLRALGFQQVGPLGVGPWRYVGRNKGGRS